MTDLLGSGVGGDLYTPTPLSSKSVVCNFFNWKGLTFFAFAPSCNSCPRCADATTARWDPPRARKKNRFFGGGASLQILIAADVFLMFYSGPRRA
jgi:hypothetical protein